MELLSGTGRIVLAIFLTALVACGERREEAAQRIGVIDLDPRKTLGNLRKTISAEAKVRDLSHHKTRDLVKLQYGAAGGEALVELWFHSASSEVAAAARPITVIARHPFKGSILGVSLGDSRPTAVRALIGRRQQILAMEYYQADAKPPPPPPGGWAIPVAGAHLTWTPTPSGAGTSDAADRGGELRYSALGYSIHEGIGITVHFANGEGPAGIAPGSFPFVLHPVQLPTRAAWRLLADGNVIADSTGTIAGNVRELPVSSSSEDGPVLTAKVLLPCGWRDVPIAEQSRIMPRLWSDGTFAGRGDVTFAITGSFPLNSIIVDNRKRPASILKQGQVDQPVAADGKTAIWLPAPDCENAASLELNGEVVAKLPVVGDEKDASGAHYLLDPTGRHCYQFKTVRYGIPVDKAAADAPVRLVAQRLHRLPAAVDHVFETAPQRVEVAGGTFASTRNQLIEVSCP